MEWSDRIGRRIRLRDLHILLAVRKLEASASLTTPTGRSTANSMQTSRTLVNMS
jgi:hypothetical protein